MTKPKLQLIIALVTLGPLGIGCSASRVAVEEPDPVDIVDPVDIPVSTQPTTPEENPEEFDPPTDRPPSLGQLVQHDVPACLLEGRAGPASEIMARGFRIQVLSERSRQQADNVYGQVLRWWGREFSSEGQEYLARKEDGTSPIYLEYYQPYWRVRIGDFATRPDAEVILPKVRERFANAFVAPSQISVGYKPAGCEESLNTSAQRYR